MAEEKLLTYQAMNMDLALKIAQDTMQACQNDGYQISVAVVDRSGVLQVLLRDQLAGIFSPDIAVRKARTALNFHTDTLNLREPTESGEEGSGVRQVPGALMVAGGVRVEAAGSIVGSVGVSGAPDPKADDACARAGLEASSDILNF
ncbi:MAG: heme-binding protein [Rhodospirillaceae bacterium]|nr:heme-binding protein [Rhodospirillaceae bacterium]MBT5563451.1 heme-binding protein [Rhodospirillaceae bacterium]MBT6241126.1 heme-binding protein [Rhodospirillaceae bacterium]MBT7137597.1 heme-binding protein [Rhodospirillaceae bacterium]